MTAAVEAPTAAPVVGWFEPGSPDWHAARANGIGGSEIAAVLGLSPFESYFSLWYRKQGLIGPVQETQQMRLGKRFEPGICDEFAYLNPELTILPAPTYHGDGRPWQIANPDRLILNADGELEVLEAKNVREADGWGLDGSDVVPPHYEAQGKWYADTLGAKRIRYAVGIGGCEIRQYVIEHDPADGALMRERAEAFLQTIRDGVAPEVDGHSATYQAIRELPDGLENFDVQIDAALRDRLFTALDTFDAAETEKRAAIGAVLAEIGNGRRAMYGKERIGTRSVRNGKTHALHITKNRNAA